MKSAGAGHERRCAASFRKACRNLGTSRSRSNRRSVVRASAHAIAVPAIMSAAGVRSSDKQSSLLKPSRISS